MRELRRGGRLQLPAERHLRGATAFLGQCHEQRYCLRFGIRLPRPPGVRTTLRRLRLAHFLPSISSDLRPCRTRGRIFCIPYTGFFPPLAPLQLLQALHAVAHARHPRLTAGGTG